MALLTGFDSINAASDTFSDWLTRTNELSELVRTDIITANSSGANTDGDAILNGTWVANTIVAADEIRGGDLDTSGALTISSNASFSANLAVTGTLSISSGNLSYVIDSSNFNDLIPTTTGDNLGNSSNRWDGFFANVDASNVTVTDTLSVDTLSVTNEATIANVSFTGTTSFADLDVTGALTVTGSAEIANLQVETLVTNSAAIIGTNETVNSTADTVIDTFVKTDSKGFKYIIHGDNDDATSAYAIEINCSHNGTDVFFTRFGEVSNNFDAVLTPEVNGANIDLVANCSSASGSNVHSFNIVRIETRNG